MADFPIRQTGAVPSPSLSSIFTTTYRHTMQHTAQERFLRYVQIDTQSDPESPTIPSTEKQKDLSRVLVEELHAMGIADAHLDEHGYVYATIPANTDKKVPVLCFCSHVDTSPDCSGAGVKPIVHANYRGQDLVLPDDPSVVIRQSEHPDLKAQMGNDIITASGTTLLGADNKAGVAAIMSAAQILLNNPQWKHGKIRILFTPDEEIGRGTNKIDMKKLGARYGYTIDGETAGSIENETFSADGAGASSLASAICGSTSYQWRRVVPTYLHPGCADPWPSATHRLWCCGLSGHSLDQWPPCW